MAIPIDFHDEMMHMLVLGRSSTPRVVLDLDAETMVEVRANAYWGIRDVSIQMPDAWNPLSDSFWGGGGFPSGVGRAMSRAYLCTISPVGRSSFGGGDGFPRVLRRMRRLRTMSTACRCSLTVTTTVMTATATTVLGWDLGVGM
jgi:hypothetical protein